MMVDDGATVHCWRKEASEASRPWRGGDGGEWLLRSTDLTGVGSIADTGRVRSAQGRKRSSGLPTCVGAGTCRRAGKCECDRPLTTASCQLLLPEPPLPPILPSPSVPAHGVPLTTKSTMARQALGGRRCWPPIKVISIPSCQPSSSSLQQAVNRPRASSLFLRCHFCLFVYSVPEQCS